MKKGLRLLFSILPCIVLLLCGCGEKPDTMGNTEIIRETDFIESTSEIKDTKPESSEDSATSLAEEGTYSSKEEVAAYIYEFGHLPSNYITKKEARELGWDNKEGNLWEVAPGKSIGGDKFGNREGLLPEKTGRQYYECDIDFEGEFRNGKRIVYSDDGLIYYTEDHYESFELLYGEE